MTFFYWFGDMTSKIFDELGRSLIIWALLLRNIKKTLNSLCPWLKHTQKMKKIVFKQQRMIFDMRIFQYFRYAPLKKALKSKSSLKIWCRWFSFANNSPIWKFETPTNQNRFYEILTIFEHLIAPKQGPKWKIWSNRVGYG